MTKEFAPHPHPTAAGTRDALRPSVSLVRMPVTADDRTARG
jgi:hypothetical protein